MIRTATLTRPRLGDATAALIGGGIGAGVSLATDAVNEWMASIQLSHNADSATTAIVNGLGQELSNLDAAYFAESNPTCADQRAALNAYDQAWLWLQSPQACGNPNYGAAGGRCIADRAPGGRYPWQTYYRDPIANDPRVKNCDTSQQVLLPSLATGTYQPAGITASGGSSTTGQTAAQLYQQAAGAATPAAAPAAATISSVTAGIPTPVIIGGLLLVAFLLTSGGGR